jgi:hypothetical protein
MNVCWPLSRLILTASRQTRRLSQSQSPSPLFSECSPSPLFSDMNTLAYPAMGRLGRVGSGFYAEVPLGRVSGAGFGVTFWRPTLGLPRVGRLGRVGGGFYAEEPLGRISGAGFGVTFRRPTLGLSWGGLVEVGRRWLELGVPWGRSTQVGFAPRFPLGWVHRVPLVCLGWVGAKRCPGGGVRHAQLLGPSVGP